MLQRKRGNPKIFVRDGRTGAFQLHEQARVVLRGFPFEQ